MDGTQQGTTTQTTGASGNSGNGSQGSGEVGGRLQGEHPRVQQAITGNAPALPKAAKASKTEGEGSGQSGSGEGIPGVSAEENREPEETGRIKLKVYGEEREYDLNNAEDRKTILREAQQSLAARKKFEESNKKEAQIQQVWNLLTTNPSEALRQAGHDPLNLAKLAIAEQLKQEMMDPHERARMDEQKRREHAEAQLHQRVEQEQRARQEAEKAHHAQRWQTDILGALEKVSDLPKEPSVIRMIAQNILDAKANGISVTAEEAAHYTRTQIQHTLRSLANKMSGEQLIRLLDKANVDKIRQHLVSEVQNPLKNQFAKAPSQIPVQDANSPNTRDRKWKTWSTYRDDLDRKVQN